MQHVVLDRIDMHIKVPSIAVELLTSAATLHNESCAVIRSRVQHAMTLQQQRSNKANSLFNIQTNHLQKS